MTNYEPTNEEKREFIEQQIASMRLTYYRNKLDTTKAIELKEQTDEKWQATYDQKLNEYKLQNDEIETSIDLMLAELETL